MSVRKQQNLQFHNQCQNHCDRNATYVLAKQEAVPNSSQQFFCEKCSIILASQGFNVCKFKLNTPLSTARTYSSSNPIQIKTNRNHQSSSFLKRLKRQLKRLEAKHSEVWEHLLNSESAYGQLFSRVNSYFEELEQIIELQKYKTYNNLLNLRVKGESQIRKYKEQLRLGITEITQMIEDIKDNQQIVNNVTQEMYEKIIYGYHQKTINIQSLVQQCPYFETFQGSFTQPEISPSIYSLADRFFRSGITLSVEQNRKFLDIPEMESVLSEAQHNIQFAANPDKPCYSDRHQQHEQTDRHEQTDHQLITQANDLLIDDNSDSSDQLLLIPDSARSADQKLIGPGRESLGTLLQLQNEQYQSNYYSLIENETILIE